MKRKGYIAPLLTSEVDTVDKSVLAVSLVPRYGLP